MYRESDKYIANYKIIKEIGSGSMGIVYLVEDPDKQESYALKKMKPVHFLDLNKIKRFENEARLISQLDHPNIVKIVNFGKDNGIPYIVMEYMDGGSLSDLLSFGVMNIHHAVYLFSSVLEGMRYAHSVGVRHADLKTSNILLKKNGQVKITDFGLATIVITSERMGTPAYMAPEVITADKVDQRADIYSLGVILYEITTGKLPFQGKSAYEVLQKHLKEKFIPPSNIIPNYPKELENIIYKALHKNPEQRYSSVREMIADFDKLMAGLKPPVASFGIELSLKTFPDQAEIYYDNVFRGLSPVKITGLLPGEGSLVIKKKGYQKIEQKFNFKSPVSLSLNYRLKSFDLPLYEVDLGNLPACNYCLMETSLLVGAKHGELLEVNIDSGSIISSIFVGGEFSNGITCSEGLVLLPLKDNRIAFLRTAINSPYLKGSTIYKIINLGERVVGETIVNLLRVYIGTENGSLYCLKSTSAEVVFKRTYDFPLQEISMSPYHNIIYLSFYNGLFKAVDCMSGEDIWSLEIIGSSFLSPIFREGIIILATKEGMVYSLNAKNGKTLFRQSLNKQIRSIVSMNENRLYFFTASGTVLSTDMNRQELLWETNANSKYLTSNLTCYPAYMVDNLINLILSSGFWLKIDRKSGRVVFEHDFGSSISNRPVERNGVFYVIDDSGKLYAVPLT